MHSKGLLQVECEVALASLLSPFKAHVEEKIAEGTSALGPPSSLREACCYALQNGGKRFRPALVLLIAQALQNGLEPYDGALATEFFHTASLIADDLPCMDDEAIRRGKPCVHKVFGESLALLASYTLIAEGYERIRKNAQNGTVLDLALECASRTTGIWGATGGQFLDLAQIELNEELLRKAIRQKTGALFELSFVLGWLFGGGNPEQLPSVKRAAHHFGMAFQIVDDFDDLPEDLASGRKLNYPALCGEAHARAVLYQEREALGKELEELQLHSKELDGLLSYLI